MKSSFLKCDLCYSSKNEFFYAHGKFGDRVFGPFHSRLHFIHTLSVALLATTLLPASKSSVSENRCKGGRLSFQHSTTSRRHVSNIDGMVTIGTGAR